MVVAAGRYRLRPRARLFFRGVGTVPLTDEELYEQEARAMCRESDMPEHLWPHMRRTLGCAGRVLAYRLREFTDAAEAELKRLAKAAGFQ
jgi:hypothetical protein